MFVHKSKGLSRYDSYLNYVESLCARCGLLTQRDQLRIPSTKNMAFVRTPSHH
jgi:predicted Zn-ribbon and HTH transcriptional regulator